MLQALYISKRWEMRRDVIVRQTGWVWIWWEHVGLSLIVTTSAEVDASPCSGGWRRRSSSHRRSIFHFPFVLSRFPTHLVLISLMCCVFNPLFPPCLCVVLFICKCTFCLTGARRVIVPILCISYSVGFTIKLLRLLSSSALLRLTSLPPDNHTPYSDTVSDLFRIQGTLNQHGYHRILRWYAVPHLQAV